MRQILCVLLLSAFALAQAPQPILKVDGKIITAEDWAKLPRATVVALTRPLQGNHAV